MTDSRIRMLYREAKNKNEMLYVILPQLTLKPRQELKEILGLNHEGSGFKNENDGWSINEIQYVKEHCNYSDVFFAKRFEKTIESVKSMRLKYCIPHKKRKYNKWSENEVDKLCVAYNCGLKTKQIAELIEKTVPAVESKIAYLKNKGIIFDKS